MIKNIIAAEDSLRNRHNSKDRPERENECRSGLISLQTQCKLLGHDWVFKRFDNYGCCTRCGCEVIT